MHNIRHGGKGRYKFEKNETEPDEGRGGLNITNQLYAFLDSNLYPDNEGGIAAHRSKKNLQRSKKNLHRSLNISPKNGLKGDMLHMPIIGR